MSGTRRPRISLLSLLLLTAVVALAATVALQWQELGPLRAENRRLRDEVGELSIDDPAKLHAIRVDTGEPRTWKWRVWVPDGKAYRVCLADRAIPTNGFPDKDGSLIVDRPGEGVITFAIRRAIDGEGWRAKLSGGSGSLGTGGDDLDWAGEASAATYRGVGESTVRFDDDQPAVLIRYRTAADVNSSSDIPDTADGFLIWLEPK
ncbi:MAG: hypothetical protein AAF805_00545 [Planctomycetota bacterium]